MVNKFLLFAEACSKTYDKDNIPLFEDSLKTVHVFMTEIDGIPTFAWEGTSDFQEWMIDFLAVNVPLSDHPLLGKIHSGFLRDILAIKPKIWSWLEEKGWPEYYNTGHSKGAAESIVFHALMKAEGHAPKATYSFEPPRVGTQVLVDYMSKEPLEWTYTKNSHGIDLVCQVPFETLLFQYKNINDHGKELIVPDTYDIPTKHRIPAVLEAIKKLP